MATVYVTMGKVGSRGRHESVDVFLGDKCRSETITSSGTAASGSLEATRDEFAQVFCATAVYAVSGDSPTATATNGIFCPGGTVTAVGLSAGHTISVIDA